MSATLGIIDSYLGVLEGNVEEKPGFAEVLMRSRELGRMGGGIMRLWTFAM